jgi:cytochrome c oxidase subunit 2
MFGMAAGVYVVVAALIFWAALRNHGRVVRPSRLEDHRFILFGGVLGPVVILMLLAVVTVDTTANLRQPRQGRLRIEVEGVDWFWKVRYLDERFETANEIHVPVGRQVEVQLISRDVIHSFWVPQLAGKVDLVPGQRNVLRFTAEAPGSYLGECAEYCGLQHANMRFLVIAQAAADYQRWVAGHTAPPAEPPDEMAARGRVVFVREACAGCHAIRGTEADGTFGPDLSDFGGRRTIGAGTVPNTTGYLAGWISDAQSIKPRNLMPPVNLNPADLAALVAYLESLKG